MTVIRIYFCQTPQIKVMKTKKTYEPDPKIKNPKKPKKGGKKWPKK